MITEFISKNKSKKLWKKYLKNISVVDFPFTVNQAVPKEVIEIYCKAEKQRKQELLNLYDKARITFNDISKTPNNL